MSLGYSYFQSKTLQIDPTWAYVSENVYPVVVFFYLHHIATPKSHRLIFQKPPTEPENSYRIDCSVKIQWNGMIQMVTKTTILFGAFTFTLFITTSISIVCKFSILSWYFLNKWLMLSCLRLTPFYETFQDHLQY